MCWLTFWLIGAVIVWIICTCFILDSYAESDVFDWTAAFIMGLTSWLFIAILVLLILYAIYATIADGYKVRKLIKQENQDKL